MDNTITPEISSPELDEPEQRRDTAEPDNLANEQPIQLENATKAQIDRTIVESNPQQSIKFDTETPDTAHQTAESDQHRIVEEKAARKRLAILKSVQDQYRVADSKYYFKDQLGSRNVLAFADHGQKLSTRLNTERVTHSLVALAESKGWTSIRVSGHLDFRRQVWREATERNMLVSGFKPTSKDLETLSTYKKTENSIEPEKVAVQTQDPLPDESSIGTRKFIGTLVAEGSAPYHHKEDGSPSYFVTIETSGGVETIWGVDLMRAMNESDAIQGDTVSVIDRGKKPVTVLKMLRDDQGKVTGSEKIQTHRRSWDVEMERRGQVIRAVAQAFVDQMVTNPEDRQRIVDAVQARIDNVKGPLPTVPMYDNNARTPSEREPQKDSSRDPELTR